MPTQQVTRWRPMPLVAQRQAARMERRRWQTRRLLRRWLSACLPWTPPATSQTMKIRASMTTSSSLHCRSARIYCRDDTARSRPSNPRMAYLAMRSRSSRSARRASWRRHYSKGRHGDGCAATHQLGGALDGATGKARAAVCEVAAPVACTRTRAQHASDMIRVGMQRSACVWNACTGSYCAARVPWLAHREDRCPHAGGSH